MNNKQYGNRIKLFRTTRGYSLKRFAKLINETQATVTGWEAGEGVPSLEVLTRMQTALELNLIWLATGKEEMLCKKPPRAVAPQIDILLDVSNLKGNSKCKEFIYAFCSHDQVREPALQAYEELKATAGYQDYLRKRYQHECGE